MGLWSLFYFFWQTATDAASAYFYCKAFMMGAIFIPILLYHFVAILTETIEQEIFLIRVGYVLSILMAVSNLSKFIVVRVEPRMSFLFWPVPGMLFHLHLFTFAFLVFKFIRLLFNKLGSTTGVKREQIKYLLLGSVIGFGGGMTNYLLWYNLPVKPFGNGFVAIYVIIIAYTIFRYRLVDINLAVRYATIYSLYVGLIGIPFVVLGWYLGMEAGSFALIFAAVFLGPLVYVRFRDQLMNVVDQLPPFRGQYLKFDELQRHLAEIDQARSIPAWSKKVVEEIGKIFFPRPSCMLTHESALGNFLISFSSGFEDDMGFMSLSFDRALIKFLRKEKRILVRELAGKYFSKYELNEVLIDLKYLRAAICIPFYYRGELSAILMLGERGDGKMYNDWDLTNLSALAGGAEHTLQAIRSGMSVEQSTAIWAHDLRRPFDFKGSFRYLGQILRGELGEIPPSVGHAVALVLNDVEFVEKNIRKLIHPGEAESISSRACSLTTTFFRIKQSYAAQAAEKEIDWRVDIPPESIRVICDSQLIEHRVLANLLVNAFRYTPRGGTIQVGYTIDGASFVGFVRDSGKGIRPEDREKIFAGGHQLDNGNKGLAGLGLLSVKTVLDAHKGKVWVEGGLGQGSCFYFELPLWQEKNGGGNGE